jgi:hypothetical protein
MFVLRCSLKGRRERQGAGGVVVGGGGGGIDTK